MKLKNRLKQVRLIRNIYSLTTIYKSFIKLSIFSYFKQLLWFLRQYKKFKSCEKNDTFTNVEFYPCLLDNVKFTPIEPTYFYQDSWASKKIFELKPKHHYDVGSSVKTMGILSQFVPTTMIDIRPIELELPNLFFKKGSILNLPFEDSSIETLSSLCVVEHIGLGRYGDEIDSFGSEKAIKELKRILKVEGIILLSVPVDSKNKIYFNAHRAFTRNYILEQFDGFKLLEEKYHYGTKMYDNYDPKKGFGTGLYMFKKEK